MKTSLDLIVGGHMVADVIGRPVFLDRPIGHGKLYLSDAIELHTGGNVCNVGIAAAKLGLRVGALGRIGNDSWRTCVLERLTNTGFDLGGVIVDKRHRRLRGPQRRAQLLPYRRLRQSTHRR
jgi:sugar/nucleoside kinase (ribokinase family)